MARRKEKKGREKSFSRQIRTCRQKSHHGLPVPPKRVKTRASALQAPSRSKNQVQTQGLLLQLEVDSQGQAPTGGWSFLAHSERGGMWEPCVGTGGDEPACLPPGDQEGRAERPSGAPGKMLRVQLPMRVWS